MNAQTMGGGFDRSLIFLTCTRVTTLKNRRNGWESFYARRQER
jgi:hypothetical protein